MATIALVNVPAWGHVNPTLDVMKILRDNGHRVLHYNTESFREITERVGAELRPIEAYVDEVPSIPTAFDILHIGNMILANTRAMTRPMADDMHAHGVTHIISDMMSRWGHMAGRRLGIPVLESYPTFPIRMRDALFSPVITEASGFINPLRWNEVAAAIGHSRTVLEAENFKRRKAPIERIIYSAFDYDPRGYAPRSGDHYVGPRHDVRRSVTNASTIPPTKRDETVRVYVSLGTIYNDRSFIFKRCMEALGNDDRFEVIMSIGQRLCSEELGAIPDNVSIRPFWDQLSALESCDVFVTHGGFNSVTEALTHSVPMVVIPQIGEQHINARRVRRIGAGIVLNNRKATVETLRESIRRVADDIHFKESAAIMSRVLDDIKNLEVVLEDWLERTAFRGEV